MKHFSEEKILQLFLDFLKESVIQQSEQPPTEKSQLAYWKPAKHWVLLYFIIKK